MSEVHRLSPNPLHDLLVQVTPKHLADASKFLYANAEHIDLSWPRMWHNTVDLAGSNDVERLHHLKQLIGAQQRADARTGVISISPWEDDDGLRSISIDFKWGFVERYPNDAPRPLVVINYGYLYTRSIAAQITNEQQLIEVRHMWDGLLRYFTENGDSYKFDDVIVPLMTVEV